MINDLKKNLKVKEFLFYKEKIDCRSLVFIGCNNIDDTIKSLSAESCEFVKNTIFVFMNSLPKNTDGSIKNHIIDSIFEKTKSLYDSINFSDKSLLSNIYVYEGESELKRYHSKNLISYGKNKDAHKKSNIAVSKVNTDDKQAYIYGGELKNHNEDLTVMEYFLETVNNSPDTKMHFYFESGEYEEYTYIDIFRLACRVANGLREKGMKAGDKLIFQTNIRDFVILFWACTMSNITVVPMTTSPSFDPDEAANQVIAHVYNTLNGSPIAVSQEIFDEYSEMIAKFGIDSSKLINIGELSSNTDENFDIVERSVDDTEFIFFTSGSTGLPKGVVQSYRAAAAQVEGCIQMFNYPKHDVYLNWMPLEHPGGILMAHLRCIRLCSTQIITSTNYILQKPKRWMDLIDKYRVNSTWAPHFAYVLISELVEKNPGKFNWDLSCVDSMLNGGEMVNVTGAKKFLRVMAQFDLKSSVLYPAWGMCETCSGTMYGMHFGDGERGIQTINKAQNGSSVDFVSSDNIQALSVMEIGRPIPGIEMRITDNNNNIVPEDTIGRFQIKGVPITSGYYNNPQVNAESFTDDGWFITGDLGFVHNGEMSITGREKDIIIINGLNYNNVEIESVIEKLPEVKTSYSGVCSVYDFDEQKDKIIAFIVPESDDIDFIKLRKKIINEVYNSIKLKLDIIIPLNASQIPKTNLGKIQRAKLKKQYENGDYDEFLQELDVKLDSPLSVPEWMYSVGFEEMHFNVENDVQKTAVIYGRNNNTGVIHSDFDIFFGEGYSFDENSRKIIINTDNSDEFVKLVTILNEKNITRIIYADTFFDSEDDFDCIKNNHLFPLMQFMKAVINNNVSFRELIVIENCVYDVDGNGVLNSKSGVFSGLISCFNSECMDINTLLIDSDSVSLQLINNIAVGEYERIYLRNNKIYKNILNCEKLDIAAETDSAFVEDGVYCIIGGLGGIGFELALYLIRKLRAKLLIIGRTDEDDLVGEKYKNLLKLNELSEKIIYKSCSCDDKISLEAAIRSAEECFDAHVNGIFHLAGLGNLKTHFDNQEYNMLTALSRNAVENMYKAKVYGTINLVDIVSQKDNCFLAVSSSTTAFWGSASFAAYSSANSFIDSYIAAENKNNKNIFALSFSSWADTGMSKGSSFGTVGAARGFMDILPYRGVVTIDLACRQKRPLVMIGIDKNGTAIRPYINEINLDAFRMTAFYDINESSNINLVNIKQAYIFENGLPSYIETKSIESSGFVEEEKNSPYKEKLFMIWKNLTKAENISMNSDFFELGGNSLLAAQLVNAIGEEFSVPYDFKTVLQNSKAYMMLATIEERINNIKMV